MQLLQSMVILYTSSPPPSPHPQTEQPNNLLPLSPIQCWVPSVSMGTCLNLTKPSCSGFGVETSYDSPIACCNRLMQLMAASSINAQEGSMQVAVVGVCSSLKLGGHHRRALTSGSPNSSSGSGLVEAAATVPDRRRSLAAESGAEMAADARLWEVPSFDAATTCADGTCVVQQVGWLVGWLVASLAS